MRTPLESTAWYAAVQAARATAAPRAPVGVVESPAIAAAEAALREHAGRYAAAKIEAAQALGRTEPLALAGRYTAALPREITFKRDGKTLAFIGTDRTTGEAYLCVEPTLEALPNGFTAWHETFATRGEAMRRLAQLSRQ